eukprot:1828151-Amphidinium_carterae.1
MIDHEAGTADGGSAVPIVPNWFQASHIVKEGCIELGEPKLVTPPQQFPNHKTSSAPHKSAIQRRSDGETPRETPRFEEAWTYAMNWETTDPLDPPNPPTSWLRHPTNPVRQSFE